MFYSFLVRLGSLLDSIITIIVRHVSVAGLVVAAKLEARAVAFCGSHPSSLAYLAGLFVLVVDRLCSGIVDIELLGREAYRLLFNDELDQPTSCLVIDVCVRYVNALALGRLTVLFV